MDIVLAVEGDLDFADIFVGTSATIEDMKTTVAVRLYSLSVSGDCMDWSV